MQIFSNYRSNYFPLTRRLITASTRHRGWDKLIPARILSYPRIDTVIDETTNIWFWISGHPVSSTRYRRIWDVGRKTEDTGIREIMGGAIISGERRGSVRREMDLSTCFSNGSYTRHRLFHGDVYSRDPGPCFLPVFRFASRVSRRDTERWDNKTWNDDSHRLRRRRKGG